MTLNFRPRRSNQGFDGYTSPVTQIIPEGDVRTIIVTGREDLKPRFQKTFGASPVFPDTSAKRRRMVWDIRGVGLGGHIVEWVTDRKYAGTVPNQHQLGIFVLPELKFRTTFHFVKDGPGDKLLPSKTKRREGILKRMLKETNRILQPQMNVCVEKKKVCDITLDEQIGRVINVKRNPALPGARVHWDKVIAHRDKSVDLNVFFVWDLNVDDKGSDETLGAALSGEANILIDDQSKDPGVTLAHELLHVLGRDHTDNKMHLMAETYEEGGIFIPSRAAILAHSFAKAKNLGTFEKSKS